MSVLDLGIKVDPGAIAVSQGWPVSRDGAGVLQQGEGDGGGVGGLWQRALQLGAEDICCRCHGLQAAQPGQ